MKKRTWVILLLALAMTLCAGRALAGHQTPDGGSCDGMRQIRDFDDERHQMYCTQCNLLFWEDHVPKTTATCSQRAVCYLCGRSYGETAPHNLVQHEAKEATCTEDGWEAYETCRNCDYSTQQIIPAGHDFGFWRPNYDAERTHTRVCKRDGSHFERAACSLREPTCDTPARCWDCWTTYGEPDPNNHRWHFWTLEPPRMWRPNGDGTHTRFCDYSQAHSETDNCSGGGATCTKEGRCDLCGRMYKAPHRDDDRNHLCDACGEKLSEHDFTAKSTDKKYLVSAATCTSPAVYYTSCTLCGEKGAETFESGEKDLNNHDLAHHDGKAATCTEPGWDAYDACSRCDYTTYKELPAPGHDLVKHEARAATCTESGWDAYDTCSRCDYTTYKELPALGHDLVKHEAKTATCTEPGWDAYDTCSRCDYTTYREILALEHDYRTRTIKPACTEDGYTRHACARCGDTFTDRRTEKLWHWFGEWIPSADGTHSALCQREGCGYTGTVLCAPLEFALITEGEDAPFSLTLCPICGEYADGARFALIEDATAEAAAAEDTLPAGELVLRMGALGNGHVAMSVGFEYDGRLVQPKGLIRIALPAALLEGHTLSLVSADGTETALTVETDGESASFVLDFTDVAIPAMLIRLLPTA